MHIQRISSARNAFVGHCLALRDDARYRREHNQLFVEGEILSLEALKAGPPSALIADRQEHLDLLLEEAIFSKVPPCYLVTPTIMSKLSACKTPEGLALICSLPNPGSLRSDQRWLICDRVADPGNLGTLIRSARAFEWDGVFLTPGCSDPYNSKALSASRGACLQIPLAFGTADSARQIQSPATRVLVATAGTHRLSTPLKSEKGVWLIVGSESHGVCRKLQALGELISIRSKGMESLNVACAGAILMHAFQQKASHLQQSDASQDQQGDRRYQQGDTSHYQQGDSSHV